MTETLASELIPLPRAAASELALALFDATAEAHKLGARARTLRCVLPARFPPSLPHELSQDLQQRSFRASLQRVGSEPVSHESPAHE